MLNFSGKQISQLHIGLTATTSFNTYQRSNTKANPFLDSHDQPLVAVQRAASPRVLTVLPDSILKTPIQDLAVEVIMLVHVNLCDVLKSSFHTALDLRGPIISSHKSAQMFDDNGYRRRLAATKIWRWGGSAVAEWGHVGRGRGGCSAEVAVNRVEVPGGERGLTSGGAGWRCSNLTSL
jgi:hypothetical protein